MSHKLMTVLVVGLALFWAGCDDGGSSDAPTGSTEDAGIADTGSSTSDATEPAPESDGTTTPDAAGGDEDGAGGGDGFSRSSAFSRAGRASATAVGSGGATGASEDPSRRSFAAHSASYLSRIRVSACKR